MSGIPRTRLRIKQSKPLPRRPSPAAQPRVSDRLGIPSERLMDAA